MRRPAAPGLPRMDMSRASRRVHWRQRPGLRNVKVATRRDHARRRPASSLPQGVTLVSPVGCHSTNGSRCGWQDDNPMSGARGSVTSRSSRRRRSRTADPAPPPPPVAPAVLPNAEGETIVSSSTTRMCAHREGGADRRERAGDECRLVAGSARGWRFFSRRHPRRNRLEDKTRSDHEARGEGPPRRGRGKGKRIDGRASDTSGREHWTARHGKTNSSSSPHTVAAACMSRTTIPSRVFPEVDFPHRRRRRQRGWGDSIRCR